MLKANLMAVLMCVVLFTALLAGCTNDTNAPEPVNNAINNTPQPSDDSVRKLIEDKVSSYTKNTFRFTEEFKLEEKGGGEAYSLLVSFVPEVGSVPIKQDMYRSAAQHAYAVSQFFPEINSYSYSVLWNESEKKEVMRLELNEEAVKQLSSRYLEEAMNEKSGLKGSYQSIFSSVTVTGAAEKWHDS